MFVPGLSETFLKDVAWSIGFARVFPTNGKKIYIYIYIYILYKCLRVVSVFLVLLTFPLLFFVSVCRFHGESALFLEHVFQTTLGEWEELPTNDDLLCPELWVDEARRVALQTATCVILWYNYTGVPGVNTCESFGWTLFYF